MRINKQEGWIFTFASITVETNASPFLRVPMKILRLMAITVLMFTASEADADPRISDIRKECRAIRDAVLTLHQETIEIIDCSTEGGIAMLFRDGNGSIRLIRVELYSRSGKEFNEYYYRNGLLIFALHEHHRYNMPFNVSKEDAKKMGVDYFDPRKTRITEDRYYFDNGTMIKWLAEDKKDIAAQSREFRDAEKEVISFSNQMLAKCKRKN